MDSSLGDVPLNVKIEHEVRDGELVVSITGDEKQVELAVGILKSEFKRASERFAKAEVKRALRGDDDPHNPPIGIVEWSKRQEAK